MIVGLDVGTTAVKAVAISPTGEVLDGWHRICKAFLQGMEELDAVQLTTMPAYRWRVLLSGEEVAIVE